MHSTSMPPAAGAGLEPGFRGVIHASFGTRGDTADINSGGQLKYDLRFASADSESLSNLKSVLERSHVGARLVLTGPRADIRAAAAVAAECGLLEGEVTLQCNESEPRVVYCPHCRTATTIATAESEVQCQGCATTLAITDHYSRRMGAYLGFSAYAEEAS